MQNQALTILLLGPSGSGKGTQAQKLFETHRMQYIQSGEMLRNVAAEDSAWGRKVARTLQEGFVPADWILQMMKTAFAALDPARGLVIDGFSRKLPEIKALIECLRQNGRDLDLVLIFSLNDTVATERLLKRKICESCKRLADYKVAGRAEKCAWCDGKLITRADDNAVAIAKRLEDYHQETIPVIDFLQKEGFRPQNINADLSPEEVFKQIENFIAHNQQKNAD